MPLSAAVGGLLTGIETAYNNAVENGAKEDNSSGTQESLAADMGEAIDQYYSQALVTTNVTVLAGQSAPPGATTDEGKGNGVGSIAGLDISTLKLDLEAAYNDAATAGESGDPIPYLANDIGTAIHRYMESGTVTTAVTVYGGQLTAPPIGIAPVPLPGSQFTGSVRFDPGDVDNLITDIEAAYNNAKTNGESGSSLAKLAADMYVAINKFALTGIVETSGVVIGGQPTNPPGYPGTPPIPSVTLPGSGEGEGELS